MFMKDRNYEYQDPAYFPFSFASGLTIFDINFDKLEATLRGATLGSENMNRSNLIVKEIMFSYLQPAHSNFTIQIIQFLSINPDQLENSSRKDS